MGFPNIICEGNALNVILSLQCSTISLHSTIEHVILEARRFLGSFYNWMEKHVFREVNFVVHNIARLIVLCNHLSSVFIEFIFVVVASMEMRLIPLFLSSPSVVVEWIHYFVNKIKKMCITGKCTPLKAFTKYLLKSNGSNSISKDALRDEDYPWLINCTTQEYLVNVGQDSHFIMPPHVW